MNARMIATTVPVKILAETECTDKLFQSCHLGKCSFYSITNTVLTRHPGSKIPHTKNDRDMARSMRTTSTIGTFNVVSRTTTELTFVFFFGRFAPSVVLRKRSQRQRKPQPTSKYAPGPPGADGSGEKKKKKKKKKTPTMYLYQTAR